MLVSKRSVLPVVGVLSFAIATGSAAAATFVVDSTADVVDATPGDGFCDDGTGACTLRAAVMEANALPGDDAIDLTGVVGTPIELSIDGVDETWIPNPVMDPAVPYVVSEAPTAASGDLDITESLAITGAGAALTVIQWSEASKTDGNPGTGDRIFQVKPTDSDLTVSIAGLTVRNGSVATSDIEVNPNDTVWEFRRLGGGISIGTGAAIALFDPNKVPGPGDGGPPANPGGDEGEGGSILGVTLDDVWIVANASDSDAGGLFGGAVTTLGGSAVSGNLSGGNGGGVYVAEPMLIENSTIGSKATVMELSAGNLAENGGGIFDTGSHTTRISGSSVVGNDATGGGGIASRTGVTIDILNSTISENAAFDVGGGITTNGTVNLRSVTVARNGAESDSGSGGGGLNSFGSGTFTLGNVVLADNLRGMTPANCGCTGGNCAVGGRFASQGANMEDTDSCGFFLPQDFPNTDPMLLPLADNGGLTETHDLDPASPAIDVGSQPLCDSLVGVLGDDTDQRGLSRTIDGDGDGTATCDIGAVEFAPEPGATALMAAAVAMLAALRGGRRTG